MKSKKQNSIKIKLKPKEAEQLKTAIDKITGSGSVGFKLAPTLTVDETKVLTSLKEAL